MRPYIHFSAGLDLVPIGVFILWGTGQNTGVLIIVNYLLTGKILYRVGYYYVKMIFFNKLGLSFHIWQIE